MRALGNAAAISRSARWCRRHRSAAAERRTCGRCRRGLGVVAVVAAPRARRDVQRERDVAVRALGHPAARAALRVVGVPAPVEEEHGLLAALESLRDRVAQRAREQRAGGGFAPQVHDPHLGQRAPVDAPRQREQLVLAARDVGVRLERGRGGAEHHRDAEHLRAPHGDVAGVVAELRALLVCRLVLLVHHDQRQLRQRREHRGARADHHVERAAARELPVAAPLPHREIRVEHADARSRSGGGSRAPAGCRAPPPAPAPASGPRLRARPQRRAGRPRSCRWRSRRGAGTARTRGARARPRRRRSRCAARR
jgi:hypothetical protein